MAGAKKHSPATKKGIPRLGSLNVTKQTHCSCRNPGKYVLSSPIDFSHCGCFLLSQRISPKPLPSFLPECLSGPPPDIKAPRVGVVELSSGGEGGRRDSVSHHTTTHPPFSLELAGAGFCVCLRTFAPAVLTAWMLLPHIFFMAYCYSLQAPAQVSPPQRGHAI